MVAAATQLDINDCIARINELRTKQLSGTDLSDSELKEGISLLATVRTMRAGGKGSAAEKNIDAGKSLSDLGF